MATKRKLTENELIGWLMAEPIRWVLSDILLDASSPQAEGQLIKAASTKLKQAAWKATKEDIRGQIGYLHALGVAEPVAVDGEVAYTLTSRWRATVSKAFNS